MSNKTYDVLKYIQRIAIPAVIVLLTTIGRLINVDMTVAASIISAVDVCFGALLQGIYSEWINEIQEGSYL